MHYNSIAARIGLRVTPLMCVTRPTLTTRFP